MADVFDQVGGQTPQQAQPASASASTPQGDAFDHAAAGTTPDNSHPTAVSNPILGLFQGAGEAAFSTLGGVGRLINKGTNAAVHVGDTINKSLGMPTLDEMGGHSDLEQQITGPRQHNLIPQSLLDKADYLAGDTGNNIAQKVGYGGESLMEFLAGDAALKGLSIPEKLSGMADSWKILEKSPKLLNALRLGAAAMKGGTALAPEEAELLAKYPKIAALVGIGLHAASNAAVQFGQTGVRTGSVSEAAQDAAITGVTGAALEGVGKGVGHLAGKFRQGGQAIEDLSQRGGAAPSAHATNTAFEGAVNDAFGKETGTFQNQLDTAKDTVQMAGQGAPKSGDMTKFAQTAAKNAKKALSDTYTNDLKQLGDYINPDPENPTTIDYKETNLKKGVDEVLQNAKDNQNPLNGGLRKTPPGSPAANSLLQEWSKLGEPAEAAAEGAEGAAPAEGGEGEQPEQPKGLTLQNLIDARRTLGERMRSLPSPGIASAQDNADRKIYGRLLQGIDETVGQLADKAGEAEPVENPEHFDANEDFGEDSADIPGVAPQTANATKARQLLDSMNGKYREGVRPFGNTDVKALMKGNLNDVAKRLVSGGTSLDDIAAVRKAIGPQALKTIGDASIQNMITDSVGQDGELDYKSLFRKFQRINPDVRNAMYGSTGQALESALNTASSSEAGLKEIGKTVKTLIGNGDTTSLLNDPERVTQLTHYIGKDGMKTLGQSIMEQKLGEFTTGGRFQPDKFVDWWNSLEKQPEVRDQLFNVDAASKQNYNDLMSKIGTASSVKKLVKYGVLPLTLGVATGVVHGPGAALVDALAGLGGEAMFGKASSILDSIANRPALWKTLMGTAKVAQGAAKVAVKAAPVAGNLIVNQSRLADQQDAMQAAQSTLSQ